MPQFRKEIYSGKDRLEFWFTKVVECFHIKYFITVMDLNQSLFCFHMQKNGKDEWQIFEAEKLPSWIRALEEELSITIRKGKSNISKVSVRRNKKRNKIAW